jgi:glycosyltransferase involved in cell wall biosynthesis
MIEGAFKSPATSMLTVIIATHESERTLVQTLSPLVAGATTGLISEVIVADAGSRDATAEVADIAGCRFLQQDGAVGARLKAAAASARTPWFLFFRAGTVPESGWLEAVGDFIETAGETPLAAGFRSSNGSVWRQVLAARPHPDQGLLIARRLYEAVGGHPETADAETALLRRLGRIAPLAATARPPVA